MAERKPSQGQQRKFPGRLRDDPPWLPWDWNGNQRGASAIQAVANGGASPDQQQAAILAIVEGICGYYELSYNPDSERDGAFAEGKRHVGAQIVKVCKLNLSTINKAEG